jgi:glycosyltransferase involved in cell wall biosynthesis
MSSTTPLVSIIVPVYNEERTVENVLDRILAVKELDKEIIVVDDGSCDRTPKVLQYWSSREQILVLHHERNLGKGAAVRTALSHAHGEIITIQDADLEYDPNDLPRLVQALQHGAGDIVYGSRYLGSAPKRPWTKYRFAVSVLNQLVFILYGRRTTDEATGYKVLPAVILQEMNLQSRRFEMCAEITAKACRLGLRIAEIPITYAPRSRAEGKKIGWWDAVMTVWTLIKWRFKRVPSVDRHHA